MNYRQLGKTDLKLSQVSYGASPLGSVFRNISEQEGIKTVHSALDLGINYLDVSPYYGDTVAETVLGKALKGISRDKYILSTKAGRYGPDFADFDFSAQRIEASLDESCARLGVNEVDILFLHDIEFADMRQVLEESIPCLLALKKAGRIRYAGVTGYPLKVFSEVISQYEIDCILTYCRYALYDSSLTSIIPKLDEASVGIINASPTGMGLLTERGAPDWHPGNEQLKQASLKAVSLCQPKGVDITALALQFAIDHPSIASTLVGTANPANIAKNVEWASRQADAALVSEIQQIFADVPCTWPSGYEKNQDR
ncbi:MAG: aldo/keto reductase [Alteromonadaceae bacterium]|uniref:aldo/keto reductase n=1 Tax=Paraglaciecola chathamensis TaxID=368405 RepID=UPI000C3FE028|nr:aldo/keto reductase [Paraglaciecola agarilytica]MBN25506.1 aldo/keto reductase [Alteromonadaceae bacterium]|tara:strand:+ start:7250 stop:8188 length:939 start_codon:yes stop_codon:yes gene_type:complete